MKKSRIKIVLKVFLGVLITIVVGVFLFYLSLFVILDNLFEPVYSKEDLVKNLENREAEIMEAKRYYQSVLPDSTSVNIEFNDDLKKTEIFHLYKKGLSENNWDLEIDSDKSVFLLRELGWTKEHLKELKSKLDKANSIGIGGANPITIDWQRSGMGMYSYIIFNENLTDSLIAKYNDSCTYIYYKKNIVFKYGGGAIGAQCFPGVKY